VRSCWVLLVWEERAAGRSQTSGKAFGIRGVSRSVASEGFNENVNVAIWERWGGFGGLGTNRNPGKGRQVNGLFLAMRRRKGGL
jgi:hypothetical protein